MLSREQLLEAAERFGTPLYAYDAREIDAALTLVRAAFDDLRLATERLVRKDNGKVLTVSTIAALAVRTVTAKSASS